MRMSIPLSVLMVACWRLALTAEIHFKTFLLLAGRSSWVGTTEQSPVIVAAPLLDVKRGAAILVVLLRRQSTFRSL
jgi:hypothetical protein